MNQLEVLRESLGQCDEIILDALLMRNRIVEDIMVYLSLIHICQGGGGLAGGNERDQSTDL